MTFDHENPLLVGLSDAQIDTFSSKDLTSQIDRLKKHDKITDLTYLRTYTIDDKETFEIDDAISLEILESSFTIWIHISDPTTFIPLNSEIDLYARNLATSIYLAKSVTPMIPRKIVDDCFSLRSGKLSSTLSLAVNVDYDGAIISSDVKRAIIKPLYNLTYEEANELIDYAPPQEKDLSILSKLLTKRTEWRRQRGAILLEQPLGRIKYKNNIPVLNIIEPSYSRKLVSEAMILAGSILAKFALDLKVPIPYRSQSQSDLPLDKYPSKDQPLAVRNSIIKQNLIRAETSLIPDPHFSLGLDCYTQATSPLRRYSDQLVHRQILAKIDNGNSNSTEHLLQILSQIKRPQNQAIQIMREDNLSLQYEWFCRNKDKIWKTYYLRILSQNQHIVLLYFEELEMDIACKLEKLEKWLIGQSLEICINEFDTETNVILFKSI